MNHNMTKAEYRSQYGNNKYASQWQPADKNMSKDEFRKQYANKFSGDYADQYQGYIDKYNKTKDEYSKYGDQYSGGKAGGGSESAHGGQYSWSKQNSFNATAEQYRDEYAERP